MSPSKPSMSFHLGSLVTFCGITCLTGLRIAVRSDFNLQKCGEKSMFKVDVQKCMPMSDFELPNSLPNVTQQHVWNAWHHTYHQNEFRLQRAMNDLMHGESPFTIAVLGGSITAGVRYKGTVNGCEKESNWVSKLEQKMKLQFGSRVKIINLAQPGSNAGWVVSRWHASIHKELDPVDLIITEYNYNERFGSELRHSKTLQKYASAFEENEQLLHMVLNLPKKPAFLYFDLNGRTREGHAFDTADTSMHWNVAKKFAIPLIWFSSINREVEKVIWGNNVHPGCEEHTVFARVVHGVFQRTMEDVCSYGVKGVDAPLPESTTNLERTCVTYPQFNAFSEMGKNAFPVQSAGDWVFKEDVPGKPGWIAPDSGPSQIVFTGLPIKRGALQVEYLRTYEHVGILECVLEKDNAQVKSFTLDGRWEECASLSTSSMVDNIPEGIYDLKCQTDGNKFKLTGLLTC